MGESMVAVIRRERATKDKGTRRRRGGRQDATRVDGTGCPGGRWMVWGNGTRARGETNPAADDCYHDERALSGDFHETCVF